MVLGNFSEFPTAMESFLGAQKNLDIAGGKLDLEWVTVQSEGLVMHDPLILKD